jgi:hypothetical protein
MESEDKKAEKEMRKLKAFPVMIHQACRGVNTDPKRENILSTIMKIIDTRSASYNLLRTSGKHRLSHSRRRRKSLQP